MKIPVVQQVPPPQLQVRIHTTETAPAQARHPMIRVRQEQAQVIEAAQARAPEQVQVHTVQAQVLHLVRVLQATRHTAVALAAALHHQVHARVLSAAVRQAEVRHQAAALLSAAVRQAEAHPQAVLRQEVLHQVVLHHAVHHHAAADSYKDIS